MGHHGRKENELRRKGCRYRRRRRRRRSNNRRRRSNNRRRRAGERTGAEPGFDHRGAKKTPNIYIFPDNDLT